MARPVAGIIPTATFDPTTNNKTTRTNMNAAIYIQYDSRSVELFDIDGESDMPAKEIDLDALMGRTRVEVTTKRGGYHDACDIAESVTREWWELEGDAYAETIDEVATAWAKAQGWTVNEINHI